MADCIKTKHAIRGIFPTQTKLLLFNALVLSHLHYSAIVLNGISEKLITTLEKSLIGKLKPVSNDLK